MNYYSDEVSKVYESLSTSEEGLTRDEAAKRLAENGRNELAKAGRKGLIRRLLEQLANPMLIVLLIASAVSLTVAIINRGGAEEYAETGIILAVVVLNCWLGIFQESKAEKAIEALQKMSSDECRVLRGGTSLQIPSAELVVGDIILLEAGNVIPADLRLTQTASLRIEESSLTGESVPVDKDTEALTAKKVALSDRTNMAYMGSSVAYGRGQGVVTATGMNTEIGKIAGMIQAGREGKTPLQRKLSGLSKVLSFLVLGICVVIFAVRLIMVGKFTADTILGNFMLAVSLAVAAIPEGLATVVTIVLSIGVTNMAKRRAIVRHLTAVETLGCAQIICTDKTGTLTQNKMTVVESYGERETLAKAMALCCDSKVAEKGKIIGDPTENALVDFAIREGIDMDKLLHESPRVAEAPFDSNRKMMSTVHSCGKKFLQYTKGAPDEIMRVCTHALVNGKVVALTPEIVSKISRQNKDYADRALRVLACAYKELSEVPSDCAPEKIEKKLVFIGLEAMTDPVRPEVKAALELRRAAGIRVIMITGDHRETAVAIAKELGIIETAEQAVTGHDLDELTDEEFEQKIDSIFVYARVQPEHKVRIVKMFQKKGLVTAMTGDGVNDAPAIKSADIGIGMGITGTDVTKNVADIVLADDNFATIVTAVEEGRRIYDNIKKTIQFLLSSNLSEVLAIFAATVMGLVLFEPVHILFINLITDSLPAVALGVERAHTAIMHEPPRKKKESIFAGGLGWGVLYQGVFIAAFTLAAYLIIGNSTAAFLTLSMCEIFHALNMRSQHQSIFSLKKPNYTLFGTMLLSFLLTVAVIYLPFFAGIFSLQALSFADFAICLGISFAIIPAVEIAKLFHRKILAHRA